jgi:hypothetical protein
MGRWNSVLTSELNYGLPDRAQENENRNQDYDIVREIGLIVKICRILSTIYY